jgi:hypothetical protein
MLNYSAMKHLILKQFVLPAVIAVLLSACSGPGENGSHSSSNSSPAETNSNSAQQPNVAQNGTPTPAASPAPPTVQQIPPAAQSDKAAAPQNSNSASAVPASNARAPKLVVSETKIDFGTQYQGKTLNRAISIRNAGKADLNIESVVPS